MTTHIVIDTVNRNTMRSTVLEYAVRDKLKPSEAAALADITPLLKSRHILDLGVGGGRTFAALDAISDSYIGIDYVGEMVERCRERFPHARFEQGDARSMPQFLDATFDLIVFSCNGICMVDHEGRLAILREVRRLLRPGGVFMFSSYNKNCKEHNRHFIFPDFNWTPNPARLLVRSARYIGHTLFRVFNRIRYTRHEIRSADFSILNDQCHNYQTFLYYIEVSSQLEQLRAAGFEGAVSIYDLAGRRAGPDSTDDSLLYVVSP